MQAQHRIFSTLASPEGFERLSKLMADGPLPHRSALAQRVCRDFGFVSPGGAPQQASCLKALRDLSAQGRIELNGINFAAGAH